MNTYSTQTHHGTRRAGAIAWTDRHQGTTTVVAIAAAVLAGVLLGILISMVTSDTGPAALHRGGGHALATVAQARQPAVAAVTATTAGDVVAAHISRTRSPSRGGFAVGRTAGAGSGFIVIHAGARAPVRGGFSGRSLGAGHAPAAGLLRPTASGD
jgi:hypothetical protein